MKKIKIFLASSEELKDEELELSDLVEHLNFILEPQDFHIYLEKWEYLASRPSSSEVNSSIENNVEIKTYDATLSDCEICLVVFGKEFGSYTEKELRRAYERVCEKGVNPSKLYVYFKKDEKLGEDLKRLRERYEEDYKGSSGTYGGTNDLKNDFLLKFQIFQEKYLRNCFPIEVKEGRVTVNGKDLFINFSSLPCVSNVKRLNGIKNRIETIRQMTTVISTDEPLYSEKAERLRELEEEKSQMEKSIWATAVKITEFKEHKLSERLKRAIELFERGDVERILGIIDSEELKTEAESHIERIKEGKREVSEGYQLFAEAKKEIGESTEALKNNIREFQMAIQAEELNMGEGWGERVIALHENVIKYTLEIYGELSERYVETLLNARLSYSKLGKLKLAFQIAEEALSLTIKLNNKNILLSKCYDAMAWQHKENGDFNTAIIYQKKALEIEKRELGEHSNEYIGSLHKIGLFYKDQGEYDEAMKYLTNAGDKGYFKNKDNVSISNYYNDLGLMYMEIGEYQDAIEYIKKGLELRKGVLSAEHPLIALSYDCLGAVYNKLGKYEIGLQLSLKSHEITKKIFGVFHPATITSCHNIGVTYGYLGDYNKEIEYLERTVELQKDVIGESHPDFAVTLDNLAISYSHIGQIDKSVEYELKGLDINLKVFGENNINTSDSYHKLAYIYEKKGEYEKALELDYKALEIRRKVLGDNHDKTAITYNNIGFLYDKMKDFKKGLDAKIKSHNILRKKFGEFHPDVAASYMCVANGYELVGESGRAINNMKKALKISKATLGDSHERTRTIYNNLGNLYYNLEKYDLAKGEFLSALNQSIKSDSLHSSDLALNYSCLGMTYNKLGNFRKAAENFYECLNIRKNLTEPNIEKIISTLNSIIENYIDWERYNDAINYTKELIEIKKGFYDNESEEIYRSIYGLGRLYYMIDDYRSALNYFNEIIDFIENKKGVAPKWKLNIFEYTAYCYAWMGNHEKSKDYLLLLVKLKEDIYGKDSEEVLQSYFDLGSVSKELNDYEDSLKYRLKSLEWYLRNSGELSEDTETAYNNVGAQYRELGQYEKALEYIQKAYDISREMSRTEKEAIYLNRLGRVYVLKGESETAKSKFEEAISLLPHDHPEAIDSKERLNEIELNK